MFGWFRKLFPTGAGGARGPYGGFTDRARHVMQLANREAQRFNHEFIGTEHVLLGLSAQRAGVAAEVLDKLGADPRWIRREVEKLVQYGPDTVVLGRLPHTPRTQNVLAFAREEARSLNHELVDTEHLLLGLLREREGVAAQVLMNLGIGFDAVRREVLVVRGRGTLPPDPDPPAPPGGSA
jgi:ATP-dependent Clp protease ATP-binding subunit ClpC